MSDLLHTVAQIFNAWVMLGFGYALGFMTPLVIWALRFAAEGNPQPKGYRSPHRKERVDDPTEILTIYPDTIPHGYDERQAYCDIEGGKRTGSSGKEREH